MGTGAALFSQLTGDGAVHALVGTRVYPVGSAPQSPTLPYVEYELADADYPRSYAGSSGLEDAHFSLDCVAASYEDAVALAQAVRLTLDNQAGTWGGIVVQGAFVSGNGEDAAPIGDAGRDAQRWEVQLTVRIWSEI